MTKWTVVYHTTHEDGQRTITIYGATPERAWVNAVIYEWMTHNSIASNLVRLESKGWGLLLARDPDACLAYEPSTGEGNGK